METLKQVRKRTGLTQIQAAELCGVSRRTYQTYEEDNKHSEKQNDLLQLLKEKGFNGEYPALLNVRYIKMAVSGIFAKHKEVRCAYLFGSYARGEATYESDVDIIIVASPMGMAFYGLAADLEKALGKKVDLLSHRQLKDNDVFLARILEEGVKIYGPGTYQIANRFNT